MGKVTETWSEGGKMLAAPNTIETQYYFSHISLSMS